MDESEKDPVVDFLSVLEGSNLQEQQLPVRKDGPLPVDFTSTPSVSILSYVMTELAMDAEYLKGKAAKIDQNNSSSDTSMLVSRRAAVLKSIADIVQSKDKMASSMDLSHPLIKVVATYLMETFKQVMMNSEGISEQQMDSVFIDLAEALKNWEEEVTVRMEESGLITKSQ